MRVLLQAGHASWVSRSGFSYAPGGGAPGEAEWTARLARILAEGLIRHDVDVVVIGDFYGKPAPPEVKEDYDLAIFAHYDGAVYGPGRNSGCFADRAVDETQAAAADRCIGLWESLYPAATGIPLHNERRNANTNQYYAFRALTWATPGVLLEHGCGAPVGTGGFPRGEDAAFLHDHLETVAESDVEAILGFLELPAASDPTPEPPDETAVLRAALNEANGIKQAFEALLRALESRRRLKRGTVDRLIAEARGY